MLSKTDMNNKILHRLRSLFQLGPSHQKDFSEIFFHLRETEMENALYKYISEITSSEEVFLRITEMMKYEKIAKDCVVYSSIGNEDEAIILVLSGNVGMIPLSESNEEILENKNQNDRNFSKEANKFERTIFKRNQSSGKNFSAKKALIHDNLPSGKKKSTKKTKNLSKSKKKTMTSRNGILMVEECTGEENFGKKTDKRQIEMRNFLDFQRKSKICFDKVLSGLKTKKNAFQKKTNLKKINLDYISNLKKFLVLKSKTPLKMNNPEIENNDTTKIRFVKCKQLVRSGKPTNEFKSGEAFGSYLSSKLENAHQYELKALLNTEVLSIGIKKIRRLLYQLLSEKRFQIFPIISNALKLKQTNETLIKLSYFLNHLEVC